MPRILVMDDGPLSLRRLYNLLCGARQHEISTAESLTADLFAAACPRAKISFIKPRLRHNLGSYAQLLEALHPITESTEAT